MNEVNSASAAARFWFSMCVSLAKTLLGKEAVDESLTTNERVVIDGAEIAWQELIHYADDQRQAADKLAKIRASLMSRQGHQLDQSSWERDVLIEIQSVLQIKVFH